MVELPFSRIAAQYDRLNGVLSLGTHALWKRKLVHTMLRLQPRPERVLDVATGTGEIAHRFSRKVPGAEVIGLDPCAEMIEVGKAKGRKAKWIVAGSERIPLPDESVDILTCAFGVRNFTERPRAFREWARLLKPSGVVGVIEIHPIPRVWYRPLLAFYWKHLMPRLGRLLAEEKAYRYLRDSTVGFLSAPAMVEEARLAGLESLETRSLFASGMVSFCLFRKP